MADRICLIVDDGPSIRTYIRAVLEREQVQSSEADNAAQALRIIHKLSGRFDLIVTDIKMPGEMDGVDLAYSIRNTFPAIPVVLISGYADEEIGKRTAGFEFIHKPFVPDTILNTVRRIIRPADKPERL